MAELKVKISADTRGFTQGMNFTKQEVANWNRVLQQGAEKSSTAMAGRYALAFGGIAIAGKMAFDAVKDAMDFSGKMADLSSKTSLSPEFLQQVGHEAKITGSNVEEVASMVKKIAVNSQEALGGSEEMQSVFERMGISMEDLKNDSLEELFNKVRLHMHDTKLDAESIADLMKVAGRGSADLIPMLRGEKTNYKVASSAETIASLDAAGDQIDNWKAEASQWTRRASAFIVGHAMDFLTFGAHSRDVKSTLAEQATQREVVGKASAREDAETTKKAAEDAKLATKERLDHEKEIARLTKDVNESIRDYQFSRLATDAERIDFLESEKKKLEDIARDFSKPQEDRLKAESQLNKKQQEIDHLNDNEVSKALDALGIGEGSKNLFKPNNQSDSLVSVGNFLGSDPSAKTNDHLKEIVDYVRETARNTRPSTTGSIFPV
jgi:hypothetical protein